MKMLIVLPFIPSEKDCGGNQAVINFIEYLRGKCELTLAFPVRHHNQKEADRLATNWPDVKIRPYKYWEDGYTAAPFKSDRMYLLNKKRMDRARNKMLSSFFCHKVVSLDPADVIKDNTLLMVNETVQDSSVPFFHFIIKLVEEEKYDIVQTEFTKFINLSYYLPANVRKVMVHHELKFVRNEDEVTLYPNKTLEDEAMLQYAKDMEISALRRFDDIIVLTEHDKNILEKLLPETDIYCSPATIPESIPYCFTPCGKSFVFVGGMAHHPNLDGVLWFAKYVIPELRKRINGVQVHIVGNWDKKFVKLISKACPEIHFEGFIDNLGAFLNGKISIVPIRIGSGMRMKILDAINSMSPFVTTVKGVEGQNFENGKECLIADTPGDFAEAMIKAASDEALQRILTENAKKKKEKDYNCAEILKRRMSVYEQICKKQHKDYKDCIS